MVGFPPKGFLRLRIQNEQWGVMVSSFVRLYTKSMLETCPGLEDLVLTATFLHHDADIYNTRLFQLKNFSSALNRVSIFGYLVQRNAAIFV
jgi:hypothetical protein